MFPDDPRSIGRYRLVGRLGEGGMGVVYAAVGKGGVQVAVKVIRGEHASDPGFRARFAREIELGSRARAASIAPVLDADPAATQPWMVTPLISGPTLQEEVRKNGPLGPEALWSLAAGVVEALLAVHEAGIVHRDLKPSNVMLAADGPKVLDFGIARAADETAITRTGVLVGSAGWISPEQYRGEDVGSASDIFNLGALLAFAATGRRPFGSGPAEVIAVRVLQLEPDLNDVPVELRDLVRSMLAKDPAQRPSIHKLATQLSSVPRTIPNAVGPSMRRPRRSFRVYPLAVGAGMTATLAVAGGVAWLASSQSSDGRPTPSPTVSQVTQLTPKPDLALLNGLGCDCSGTPLVADRLTTDGAPSRLVFADGVDGVLKMFLFDSTTNKVLWKSSGTLGKGIKLDPKIKNSLRIDKAGHVFVIGSVDLAKRAKQGGLPMWAVGIFDVQRSSAVLTDGLDTDRLITGTEELETNDLDKDGTDEVVATFGEAAIGTAFYYRWNPESAHLEVSKCRSDTGFAVNKITSVLKKPCSTMVNDYPIHY
jgi:serine/threonine protein kinase